ncbi:MAG: peptidoglycan editing factor PgeF [Clostridia bacterium]|nr:peptidoglycan editing factor PgeF [Clostridia bacterium]
MNRKGSLCFITFPKLESFGSIKHGFSTRLGGVSEGYFSSMNLSFTTGDARHRVVKNYEIFSNALGIDPKSTVLSRQTHTDNIRIVTAQDCGKGVYKDFDYTDTDALITNVNGVTLVTHSADCCLLVFFDPIKKVIASAHAGWRGTVKEIGLKTVQKMIQSFGCDPKDIIAGIAPSIGKCCYEVDDPVYNEFIKLKYLNIPQIFTTKPNGKYMLDLWEANKQILIQSGINPDNIDVTDLCTNCNCKEFHSHRATAGKRGVNALFIQLCC